MADDRTRRRRCASDDGRAPVLERTRPERGQAPAAGRMEAGRSPAPAHASATARVVTLLLLTALLVHEWLPATMAADVAQQTTRMLDVGDQEIPSTTASTSSNKQGQHVPPITSIPLLPSTEAQSSLPPTQLEVVTTAPKKRRRGPTPRVRLIKVYKKVWRDRKRPRKLHNVTDTPVPGNQGVDESKESLDHDVETTTSAKETGTERVRDQVSANDKTPVSENDPKPKADSLNQQLSHNINQYLNDEHKSDSSSVESLSSSLESKKVDFETSRHLTDHSGIKNNKKTKHSDEDISSRFLDDELLEDGKNEGQNKNTSNGGAIPNPKKLVKNDSSESIAVRNIEPSPNTNDLRKEDKPNLLAVEEQKDHQPNNIPVKHHQSILSHISSTIIPTTTVDYNSRPSTKMTKTKDKIDTSKVNPPSINEPLQTHAQSEETDRIDTSPSEGLKPSAPSLHTEDEKSFEANTFLHSNEQSKQNLEHATNDQVKSVPKLPLNDSKESSQDIDLKEIFGNISSSAESNTKTKILNQSESHLETQNQKSLPIRKESARDFVGTINSLPNSDMKTVHNNGNVQGSHLSPPYHYIRNKFNTKHSSSSDVQNEISKQDVRLFPPKLHPSSSSTDGKNNKNASENNRNLLNAWELNNYNFLWNQPTQNMLVPLDLCKMSIYELYLYALRSNYGSSMPLIINCAFTPYFYPNPSGYYGFQGGFYSHYFTYLPTIPIIINGINVPLLTPTSYLQTYPHVHSLSDFTNSQCSLETLAKYSQRPGSIGSMLDVSGFESSSVPHVGIQMIGHSNEKLQGGTPVIFNQHTSLNPTENQATPETQIPIYPELTSHQMSEYSERPAKEPVMSHWQPIVSSSTIQPKPQMDSFPSPSLPPQDGPRPIAPSHIPYLWPSSQLHQPWPYSPQQQLMFPPIDTPLDYIPSPLQLQELPGLYSSPLPIQPSAALPAPIQFNTYELSGEPNHQPPFNSPTYDNSHVPYPYAYSSRMLTPGTESDETGAMPRSMDVPMSDSPEEQPQSPPPDGDPSFPRMRAFSNRIPPEFGHNLATEMSGMLDAPEPQINPSALDHLQRSMDSPYSLPSGDTSHEKTESPCLTGLRYLRDKALQQAYPRRKSPFAPLPWRARRQVDAQEHALDRKAARKAHLKRDNSRRTHFVPLADHALPDTSVS